jgi:hypothetical protein
LSPALQLLPLSVHYLQFGCLLRKRGAALTRRQKPAISRKRLKSKIENQGREANRGQVGSDAREQDESP